MIKAFFTNRNGNVAMLFGLMLIPMLIGAGVGIDMMRAGQVRSQLGDATDAALLAAARAKLKDETLTNEQAAVIARRYFDSNASGITSTYIDEFEFEADEEVFRLKVIGRVKTTLLGISGREFMPINIENEAKVAPPRALEVVLVLDITQSMEGTKLDALTDSAKDLVDNIMADTDNSVLVGLAPFSSHVNIGISRATEPWIDVPADETWTYESCDIDEDAALAASCFEETETCYNDGIPTPCTYWTCPNNDPAPMICETVTDTATWLGCLGSRPHPLNILDEDYFTNPVPGVLETGGPECPTEVLPMTTDKTTVLAALDEFDADEDTYIPSGLFWGQALISPEAPFTEGRSYSDISNEGGVKAIVLMTDGDNTLSPDFDPGDRGEHDHDDVHQANSFTIELCDEIKSHGVILYTIAFEITDSATLGMVEDCATNPSAYFGADNATELSDAFGLIGNNLVELALTK